MSPWLTASEMYSKCIVSPLINTPIAIIASKGELDVLDCDAPVRAVRSEVEPRRSAAAPTTPVDEDWICEAEYSLWKCLLALCPDYNVI